VLINAEVSEAEAKVWEKQLRGHPQLLDVPIIALSAAAGNSIPWIERTLGVEDYILLPLGGDRLAEHLRQVYQPIFQNDRSNLYWFPR